MKRLFVLIFFCFVIFGLGRQAKADCAWFVNANCTDVKNSVATCGESQDSGFCGGIKQPPYKCCCCDAGKSGCCQKTNKATGQVTTVDSTIAQCYANGDWANLQWLEGQKAMANTCLQTGTANNKECLWLTVGGNITGCSDVGFPIVDSLGNACWQAGLPQLNASQRCCCRDTGSQANVTGTVTSTPPNVTGTITSSAPNVVGRISGKTLPNPLGSQRMTIGDVPTLVNRLISAFLAILGAIALLIIIYGGFQWMTSAGNDSQVAKGKNTMLWAAVAIIIIFLAWILESFLFQALGV